MSEQIIIKYDTSILIGKTLNQCFSLIDAFNSVLIEYAHKIVNGTVGDSTVPRRMFQNAEINPDDHDLLRKLISSKNDRVSLRVSIKYFINQDGKEDYVSFLTHNHDQNRINVVTKVDPADNIEKVEKILAKG